MRTSHYAGDPEIPPTSPPEAPPVPMPPGIPPDNPIEFPEPPQELPSSVPPEMPTYPESNSNQVNQEIRALVTDDAIVNSRFA